MPVSREDLGRWFDRLDPNTAIDSLDERYVDLDQRTLRGEDPVEAMMDCIEFRRGASCQLFSGFPGTGKSTKLRQLKARLEAEGYIVLLADGGAYHDLEHPLQIEDLLVILAASFGEAAAARLNDGSFQQGSWDRLVGYMKSEIEVTGVKLPGLAELKFAAAHESDLWRQIRQVLRASTRRLHDEVHALVREQSAVLLQRFAGSRGVVFILDSFERLSGPEHLFQATIESVVKVFGQHHEALRLPDCHVIYTVPHYVGLLNPTVAERYDGRMVCLPAVKVTLPVPGIEPFRPGIDALVEVVRRRIDVGALFGPDLTQLEHLVLYSGGHVRTLLAFCRDLLLDVPRSPLPIAAAAVEAVLQRFRERYRTALLADVLPLLHAIDQTSDHSRISVEDLPRLARCMSSHLVLCYRNGEGRYEVHPLVRDQVAKLAVRDGGGGG